MNIENIFNLFNSIVSHLIELIKGQSEVNFFDTVIIFLLLFAGTKFLDSFFLKKQRKRQEIELQRDFDISKIEEVTFQIRDLAIKFRIEKFTSQEKKIAIAFAITARLKYLDKVINRLFAWHEDMSNKVSPIYDELHEACSGYDFLSTARNDLSNLTQRIEFCSYEIVEVTLRERRKLPFEKKI